MKASRLEAFSDGVLAIVITIMVLELPVPHGHDWLSLHAVVPSFLSYVLSFAYVGIYWNNHHHMFQITEKISGASLWANLHLLFWLSLIPFSTAWMSEAHFAMVPILLYGFVLLLAGIAYYIVQMTLVALPANHKLQQAIGSDWKGKLSPVLYVLALIIGTFVPLAALAVYVLVACIWLIPDRRLEKHLLK